jgi:hypothetical protein
MIEWVEALTIYCVIGIPADAPAPLIEGRHFCREGRKTSPGREIPHGDLAPPHLPWTGLEGLGGGTLMPPGPPSKEQGCKASM